MAKLGDPFILAKGDVRRMFGPDMDNDTLGPDSNISTLDFPDPYADINNAVDRYVTVVICFIGFPGNILCFLVWMQKQMRHSSGIYLSALALADFIFLCLLVIYELQLAWDVKTIHYPVWCSVFPVLHLVAQYLSPLLVLAFTTERYISICHPFKREIYCTVRRAKMVIAGLVLLTFSLGSVQGYFFEMQYSDITNTSFCSPRKSVVAGGTKSVYSIYSTTVDMLCFLVGNVAVLVLNVLVIFEMRRLSKVEQTQLKGRSSSQKKSATTVMLLTVSFYQIITTMPVSIAYALYMEYDAQSNLSELGAQKAFLRYYKYNLALTFIKEYGITHYAFNIFIYLITGKMFREQLKILLFRSGRRSLDYTSEYSSLRSSVRASVKANNTWLHTNGNGKAANEPRIDGETLL